MTEFAPGRERIGRESFKHTVTVMRSYGNGHKQLRFDWLDGVLGVFSMVFVRVVMAAAVAVVSTTNFHV